MQRKLMTDVDRRQCNIGTVIQFVNSFDFPIVVKWVRDYQVRRHDQLADRACAGSRL